MGVGRNNALSIEECQFQLFHLKHGGEQEGAQHLSSAKRLELLTLNSGSSGGSL